MYSIDYKKHTKHHHQASVFSSVGSLALQKAMLQQTFVLFLSIQAHLALESEDFSVCTSLDGKSGQRREEQLRVFSLPHVSLVYF